MKLERAEAYKFTGDNWEMVILWNRKGKIVYMVRLDELVGYGKRMWRGMVDQGRVIEMSCNFKFVK